VRGQRSFINQEIGRHGHDRRGVDAAQATGK
jgi:hypothetical protein